MTTAQLLDLARAASVRIEPRGDKLRLRAPEKPPDDLLDLLREHKPAILEHLRQGQGIGCARPPEPHRRCPSCGGGLQPNDADLDLCGICQWAMQHLAPRRVQ